MSKPRKVISITSAMRPLDPLRIHLIVGDTHDVIDLMAGGHPRNGPAVILPFPRPGIEKELAKSAGASDPCHDRSAVKGEHQAMPIFTIDNESNLRVLGSRPPKDLTETLIRFASEQELQTLAAEWSTAQLVAIWNRIPGAVPVRRFASRQTATARIWQAALNLLPADAGTRAKQARKTPAAKKTTAATPVQAAGEQSKKDKLISLLSGGGEATIEQLMAATGWQKHSIRGFLSGTVKKRMGLKVLSTRNAEGQRVYRVRN